MQLSCQFVATVGGSLGALVFLLFSPLLTFLNTHICGSRSDFNFKMLTIWIFKQLESSSALVQYNVKVLHSANEINFSFPRCQ